jgi:hypothetical protein
MPRSIRVALVACALLTACASFNKQCFGNGVCRVEKGGVVSWEGPPDKVAEMKGKEDAQKQKAAEADRAWAEAPKRAASEPVRVALVGPTTEYADLEPFAATYRQMMEQALQGDARIQLVPYAQVKFLAEASSDDNHSSFGRKQVRSAVDEGLTRRLRETNSGVDVVLVAHLAPKKVSGFVSGGGGVGVAEMNNVEFQASVSSVYQFREFKGSQVGKSTDSVALAGVDKNGKKGSADLKQKRNPESDRAAVTSYASWVKTTIAKDIAPGLPSLDAASEIRAKHTAAAGSDLADALKKMMGNRQ